MSRRNFQKYLTSKFDCSGLWKLISSLRTIAAFGGRLGSDVLENQAEGRQRKDFLKTKMKNLKFHSNQVGLFDPNRSYLLLSIIDRRLSAVMSPDLGFSFRADASCSNCPVSADRLDSSPL